MNGPEMDLAMQFPKAPDEHTVDVAARLCAGAMWRAELKFGSIGAPWRAERRGDVLEVRAPITSDQPADEDAENKRYFGGQFQSMYAQVADPATAYMPTVSRLSQCYDARDAEKAANTPRLEAVVREALSGWKDGE